MLDHLGIQCNDVAASAEFYEALLAPLGASRLVEPAEGVIGFGIAPTPNFWLGPLSDDHTGWREDHIAFTAPDRATVRACHAAALAAGAQILHEPREWPIYHPGYFGVFVRDPDGNNVEVVCHRPDDT